MATKKTPAAPVLWTLKTKDHTAALAPSSDGFVCGTQEGAVHHVTLDGAVGQTHQVDGDVLGVSVDGGRVFALVDGVRIVDVESGDVVVEVDDVAESFCVRGRRCYVQHGTGLRVFDDGRLAWSHDVERGGTVVVDGDAVYFGQTEGLERLTNDGKRQWLAPAQYVFKVAVGPRAVWAVSYRGTRVCDADEGSVVRDVGDGVGHVAVNAAGDAFCVIESVVGDAVVAELVCFAVDGAMRWRFPCPLEYVEAVAVVGADRLVMTSALGVVCCVDTSADAITAGLAGAAPKPASLKLEPTKKTAKKSRA